MAFGCDNLIITPVSPHNLNMRPLILPGNVKIRLKVESRSGNFMLSADSRMQRMSDKMCIRDSANIGSCYSLVWSQSC